MAFRLRKQNPPYGTEDSPQWEFAYSEQVKVVDGLCDVESPSTRDYLVKLGYEEVTELSEPVLNGTAPVTPVKSSPRKSKALKANAFKAKALKSKRKRRR